MNLAPNPRLQRTPLRAPLSRKPLGRSKGEIGGRRVFAVPLAVVMLLGGCSAHWPPWTRDLESRLRCGMSVTEVEAAAGTTLVGLGAKSWLGTHFIRRGRTDLWFDFENHGL